MNQTRPMEHTVLRPQLSVKDQVAEAKEDLLARPLSIAETGLRPGLLSDLALKAVYYAGELTGQEVARSLCLPFAGVVDSVLAFLDRQKLVQVTGSAGFGERAFRYALSRKGTERAREVLERNQYVGPAPVPLEDYNRMIRVQGIGDIWVGRQDLERAFNGLVISERLFSKIGPALNSGRAIFLYGPSGNGKTTIAWGMARILGQAGIYVPYAAEIAGDIIKIYDEFNHRLVEAQPLQEKQGDPSFTRRGGEKKEERDARWVLIERPIVIVGGELTLDNLDLIYDPVSNYYEAPFQMKANGGMFLIDDFGRQQMDPRELLNRWIVPLETRVDYLTLHTGKKIEIPFEQLVVFATNLDPARLVDSAFLRRIHHKIKVDDPTPEEFCAVFRMICQQRGVPYDHDSFLHLVQEWYVKAKRALRYSHPRDIVDQILDIAKYEGHPPHLTPELVDRACDAYFADL
jgi:energy-coupling factor transporter ATP-binding protein EcfA2